MTRESTTGERRARAGGGDRAAEGAGAVRLFVAVTPPPTARAELRRATAAARTAHPGLRWSHPDDWHITLAFLGNVAGESVGPLRVAFAAVAAAHAPFDLALGGADRFGDRVLWAAVDGDLDALGALAESTRAAVARQGLTADDRPFRPHLTLARSGRGGGSGVVDSAARLGDFTGATWTAGRLHLVGSNIGRGPGPARYRDVEAWPLAA